MTVVETGWPYDAAYTADFATGCTNSVVTLTKSTGNWDVDAIGGTPLADLAPQGIAFDLSDSPAAFTFDAMGEFDLATDVDAIDGFIQIRQSRDLPMMAAQPDTICAEDGLNLATPTAGTGYLWTVYDSNWNALQSYPQADPAGINLTDEAAYYFSLQVLDDCCGWSVPVYDSVYVRPPFSAITVTNICQGETVSIDGEDVSEEGVYTQSQINSQGCENAETIVLLIDDCLVGEGCTDPVACNYTPEAITDDGSCDFTCIGCTDPVACNYSPLATIDDDSCSYVEIVEPQIFCGTGTVWDEASQTCVVYCRPDLSNDGIINTADLLELLGAFATSCP